MTNYTKRKNPLCNTINWANWNLGFVKLGVRWAERDNNFEKTNPYQRVFSDLFISIGPRRRRRNQRKHNKKVGGMGHKWWIFGTSIYSSYWGFKRNRENLGKWTFTSKSNCSWLTCRFNCRIECWKRRILLFWIRICWFQGKQ